MLEKKKYTMCMSLMVFLVWCHFENMKKSPPPSSPNTLCQTKMYTHLLTLVQTVVFSVEDFSDTSVPRLSEFAWSPERATCLMVATVIAQFFRVLNGFASSQALA